MREISLRDYCTENTQTAAAKLIGCSQGAISQMLRDKREIYIVEHPDGSTSSYERKELTARTS